MENVEKPRIIISKCLGFDKCRYNGDIINDEFIDKLNNYCEFLPVCPELEIGLGVPREPIRIIKDNDRIILYQTKTNKNFTNEMNIFSDKFLSNNYDIDGFILKSRSPSCGHKDVKIYNSSEQSNLISKKGTGIFASKVIEKFPSYPIEDEGRLKNFNIREHFLTRIFINASFRRVFKNKKINELVKFHSNNKFLFMSYNEKEMRILGKIVANKDKLNLDDLFENYREHFKKVFLKQSKHTSNINMLMHCIGFFSKKLSKEEKGFFFDLLDKYRVGKMPLVTLKSILKSWAIRYDEKYLLEQTFFAPFPDNLFEITDSGKGRDY